MPNNQKVGRFNLEKEKKRCMSPERLHFLSTEDATP
jgi:hypothetical protein